MSPKTSSPETPASQEAISTLEQLSDKQLSHYFLAIAKSIVSQQHPARVKSEVFSIEWLQKFNDESGSGLEAEIALELIDRDETIPDIYLRRLGRASINSIRLTEFDRIGASHLYFETRNLPYATFKPYDLKIISGFRTVRPLPNMVRQEMLQMENR